MADRSGLAGNRNAHHPDGLTVPDQFHQIAGESILPGQPVYRNDDTVLLAQANDTNTSHVIGIASNASSEGGTVRPRYLGPLTLTVDQWKAVTDDGAELQPGVSYFLSPDTAGKITTTRPTDDGQFATAIGIGLSSTSMLIIPGVPEQIGAGICPDGVLVTYHAPTIGPSPRVDVVWDVDNCTLDITQVSNLGTQPDVQDLVNALSGQGWTYDPPSDILLKRLEASNAGSTTINCSGGELSLSWGFGPIQYAEEGGPVTLPDAATHDC